jgi:hypothetical protein
VNHQTFERILRFRDMPGSMRDGVLVTPITPRCFTTLVVVESAARAGPLRRAGSWREVKLSSRRLLTLRFVRGGVSGFRALTTRLRIKVLASQGARGGGGEARLSSGLQPPEEDTVYLWTLTFESPLRKKTR